MGQFHRNISLPTKICLLYFGHDLINFQELWPINVVFVCAVSQMCILYFAMVEFFSKSYGSLMCLSVFEPVHLNSGSDHIHQPF